MGSAVSVQDAQSPGKDDWCRTVYALTRVAWLASGPETVGGLLETWSTASIVESFVKEHGHPILEMHVKFVREALELKRLKETGDEATWLKRMKAMHRRKHRNPLFYCTRTDIVYGKLNETDWNDVLPELEIGLENALKFLADDLLPRLLGCKVGVELVQKIYQGGRPEKNDGLYPRTLRFEAPDTSSDVWVTLVEQAMHPIFNEIHVGLCIFDASKGAIVSANDAIFHVTGYTKAEILATTTPGGQTPAFLSSSAENFAAITEAAREGKALAQRFTATKKDGTSFQCFVTMNPVVDSYAKSYRFQVCSFVDMTSATPGAVGSRFTMTDRCLGALMPSSTLCDAPNDSSLYPASLTDDDLSLSGMMMKKEEEVPVSSVASSEAPAAAPEGGAVVTGAGENKDHDGKEFGRKHADTGLDFETAAPLWYKNATHALQLLVKSETGLTTFGSFLEAERRRPLLDFYLEVESLATVEEAERNGKAKDAILRYNAQLAKDKARREQERSDQLAKEKQEKRRRKSATETDGVTGVSGGCHIPQADLTEQTAKLWTQFYENASVEGGGQDSDEDKTDWYGSAKEQATRTFEMLAVDAFTRFLLSKKSKPLHDAIRDQSKVGNEASQLARAFRTPLIPRDVEEWLQALVATIEKWPACIVVADMTIAGAPMIYVNPAFCHVTEYRFDEAVGRNCRFLQGPATEEKSKAIIRRTLKDGRDCHVLITNYRRGGETFQNLLTMRPVFDADAVYRYCIGVQFEVNGSSNTTSEFELGRLDKLLQLLPSVVPFQGDLRESEHLPASCVEYRGGNNSPRGSSIRKSRSLQDRVVYDNAWADPNLAQRFCSSKVVWLQKPQQAIEAFVDDDIGVAALTKFVGTGSSSPLAACAIEFCRKAGDLLKLSDQLSDAKQKEIAEKLVKCPKSNVLFYCTLNDPITDMDDKWWQRTIEELIQWRAVWLAFLRDTVLKPFLNSPAAGEMFVELRNREIQLIGGTPTTLTTPGIPVLKSAAGGLINATGEELFLDLLHDVAISLNPDVALVVADCRTPGLPLIYISGSFRGVTGYGKEQLGLPCSFLQGENTESYVNEEIVDALRFSRPEYSKITNYRKNGDEFQCLLTLCPIFASSQSPKYAFQIGLQVNFTATPFDNQNFLDCLNAINDVTRFLPRAVFGDPFFSTGYLTSASY